MNFCLLSVNMSKSKKPKGQSLLIAPMILWVFFPGTLPTPLGKCEDSPMALLRAREK
jgi:hypothetical protein